jgi:predicted MPP superfamily phosphohydrolase
LRLDTHDGPFGLTATADEVDLDAARRVVEDPGTLDEFDDGVVADAATAVRRVLWRAVAGSLFGALAVAALRHPRRGTLAVAAATAIVITMTTAGAARATWNPEALAEPRYTGLLTVAPQAIGSVVEVQEQYAAYRSQLASLIGNVAELYNTTAGLSSFEPDKETVRVLHVSDLHLNPQAFDLIRQLVTQFQIAVVVDSGDINDWGSEFEAQFVERIGTLGVPYVYVRGNHDSRTTSAAVAAQPNAVVLDANMSEVAGIRFWGIGDPRFTPDKTEGHDISEERDVADRFAPEAARQLKRDGPVDVAVVHDPRIASEMGGLTKLALAGHLHQPSSRQLSRETLLLVEGSTGGAGLRALEKKAPVPLSCSVLYFDREDRSLRAVDRISVAGLGSAGAQIQRQVIVPPTAEDDAEPAP